MDVGVPPYFSTPVGQYGGTLCPPLGVVLGMATRHGKALVLIGALAAAGVALAMAVARLSSNESELDDAYALMTRAMSRPGMVLHTTSTTTYNPTCVSSTEAWISDGGEKVRALSSSQCQGREGGGRTTLSVQGGWYFADRGGNQGSRAFDGCRGTTLPGLLFFLQCSGDVDVAVTHSHMKFEGRKVVQIRSIGDASGIDSLVMIDSVLYVDPATGLPIAGNPDERSNSMGRYEHEFIERSSLPADFFEPEGIGFTNATDVIEPDAITPLYWLGATTAGTDGLPGLTLQDSHVEPFDGGNLVTLKYRLTSEEFGEVVVNVITHASHTFESIQRVGDGWYFEERCASIVELTIEGARTAVLAEQRAKDGCDPRGVAAAIGFGETIVIVQSNFFEASNGNPNPYASPTAIEQLARALIVFQ